MYLKSRVGDCNRTLLDRRRGYTDSDSKSMNVENIQMDRVPDDNLHVLSPMIIVVLFPQKKENILHVLVLCLGSLKRIMYSWAQLLPLKEEILHF